MKRKKILFIITKSNFGGAQRYVYELATQLPKEEFEVAVACGIWNGILTKKLQDAQIPVFEIQNLERDINFLKEIKSLIELKKIISSFKPDTIHLNSSKAGGSGALMGRLLGVPNIIFTAHGWPFFEKRNVLWRTLVWGGSYLTTLLSHRVIVVSLNDLKNAKMPGLSHKLIHIPTSVPTIDFLPKAMAKSALYSPQEIGAHESDTWLLTNAELTPNKNLFFAVDAVIEWNRTHGKKVFYTIISDGEQKESLKAYIQNHSATSQISLLGYVNEARQYFKAFDAFLLPSLKEGMPYVLLEAGAAGLPVIASHVGGIPELIEDGYSGILIDPNDSSWLAEALEAIIDDPLLRTKYGNALQEKVAKEYSLSEMIQKTLQLYNAD